MPSAPLRACSRCHVLVERGACPTCTNPEREAYDHRRGTSTFRGYGSRWERWRAAAIRRYRLVLCGDRPPQAPTTTDSRCRALGRVELGNQLDHITPISGPSDLRLFDAANVQYLCRQCHGAKSGREARPGNRTRGAAPRPPGQVRARTASEVIQEGF
jgi:5-methylcytosine-specific restriction enzyme A